MIITTGKYNRGNTPKNILHCNVLNCSSDEEADSPVSLKYRDLFNADSFSTEIYLYSDICNESSFLINKAIVDLEKQIKTLQIKLSMDAPLPIKLYIKSYGGSISDAFSIVDRINACTVPIHTYVEGYVASAATLISMSGTKRFINKNATMLIHHIRGWFEGTYANLQDQQENWNLLTDQVKKLYLEKTALNADEINELLSHDLYLSADKCIENKFADFII